MVEENTTTCACQGGWMCPNCADQHRAEISRLKAELESKDKAIKLLQGHCNALMDTEGKLAQWKKGHTAGQEAAGYYQKQADDMIRQLRKELSDENANFTEEIMNLERQLAEERAEIKEWVCNSCRTVYPGPPQEGFACVQCPKCSGNTMPRTRWEVKQAAYFSLATSF